MFWYSFSKAKRKIRFLRRYFCAKKWSSARFAEIASIKRNNPPDNFLSVAAIFKDEGRYLKEWLDYYILNGVEKFYLYDNESADNAVEILEPYIKSGIVEYKFQPGTKQQPVAYMNAIARAAARTEWLAFIDLDEFIVTTSGTVADFLRALPGDVSQLSIGWVNYGSEGHIERPEGLVIENYRIRARVTVSLKSIFRPMFFSEYNGVHCQKVIGKTVDEDGREIFPYLDYIMPVNKIRVNHYSVKSRKEFAMRGRRGNAVDGLFRHNEKYFKSHDTNEIFDPIMDRWIKKMKSGG